MNRSPNFPPTPLSTTPRREANKLEAFEHLAKSIEPEVDIRRKRLAEIAAKNSILAQIKPANVLGGLRGIPTMLWDTSQVDPVQGLFYRGIPITDCVQKLPRTDKHKSPSVEAVIYLLLTGKIPTLKDLEVVSTAMTTGESRCKSVKAMINCVSGLTSEAHPMTQLMCGILTSEFCSQMASDYKKGRFTKDLLWKPQVIDALELLDRLPIVVGYLYRKNFQPDTLHSYAEEVDDTAATNLDWAARLARLMHLTHPLADDVLRLYMILHADHEGGNVSAHLAHIAGSAHADLFYAFCAALCGLAGPLHGLANQDALRWQRRLWTWLHDQGLDLRYPEEAAAEMEPKIIKAIEEYVLEQLGKGKVLPGFGHAVLRVQDPRYTILSEFGKNHAPQDPFLRMNRLVGKHVPEILKNNSRASSPYPNVDCGSGALLCHIGIEEEQFHTVLFGLARAIGIASNQVWSRAFKFPIERPTSMTLETLESLVKKNEDGEK